MVVLSARFHDGKWVTSNLDGDLLGLLWLGAAAAGGAAGGAGGAGSSMTHPHPLHHLGSTAPEVRRVYRGDRIRW